MGLLSNRVEMHPGDHISVFAYSHHGVGRSGLGSSVIGAPLAALLSPPLKLLMPSPVGVATMTAGLVDMQLTFGVRTDAVEDLAMNLGWGSNGDIPQKNVVSRNQVML